MAAAPPPLPLPPPAAVSVVDQPDEPLLDRVRAAMRGLREPGPHDRVHNAECVLSFDSPLTRPGGLYVNLRSFLGFGARWAPLDAARSGGGGGGGGGNASGDGGNGSAAPPGTLYLHRAQTRVPLPPPPPVAEGGADGSKPSRMAIGVEGGFAAGPAPKKFGTEERLSLALLVPPASGGGAEGLPAGLAPSVVLIPLPCPALPELVSRVCRAVAEHAPVAKQEAAHAWEEERRVSRYAEGLEQLSPGIHPGAGEVGAAAPAAVAAAAGAGAAAQGAGAAADGSGNGAATAGSAAAAARRLVSPNPADWRCDETGARENLWLNLSTGFVGSGRRNWDGTGGSGSAQRHYEATGRKHPLVVKLGTITPGGGDVYSYAADEDDMVEDPHLARHLAHWGINMMQVRPVFVLCLVWFSFFPAVFPFPFSGGGGGETPGRRLFFFFPLPASLLSLSLSPSKKAPRNHAR